MDTVIPLGHGRYLNARCVEGALIELAEVLLRGRWAVVPVLHVFLRGQHGTKRITLSGEERFEARHSLDRVGIPVEMR